MISPEVLRKYEFFGFLSDKYFDEVAMISDPVSWKSGETIFEIDTEATFLYLLESGEVELHYRVVDTLVSDKSKEFYVGSINPGEMFGLSALMPPYEYTATCQTSQDSKGIKVDAKKLLMLVEADAGLGHALMSAVAKAAFDRLNMARTELVAARP